MITIVLISVIVGLLLISGLTTALVRPRLRARRALGRIDPPATAADTDPHGATQPGAAQPGATQPGVAQPGVAQPVVADILASTGEPGGASGEATVGAVVDLDIPEPGASRMQRLRDRLSRSETVLGRGLLSVLSRGKLDEAAWEDIEEALLSSDVGVGPTMEIVDRLRLRTKVIGTASQGELRALLAEELVTALQPDMDRSLHTTSETESPAVVLVVGVNGTGKTTTCGKLARVLVADGRSVLLGAADTFRAAAADQLQTWGSRVGAATVRGPEGGDPASVAFDAVKRGRDEGVDVVLIDTAGRLHTKVGLMDELGKVKRVIERQGPVSETLLVLDATTGQNGLVQARVFTEVAEVTGIVLTKLDGTAKGGIVISVQRELGIPVKLIGLGEGPDDLAPFDPEQFVDALLGDAGA